MTLTGLQKAAVLGNKNQHEARLFLQLPCGYQSAGSPRPGPQAEQARSFLLPPQCPLRCGCATSFLLQACVCSAHLSGSQKVEQALPFTPVLRRRLAPSWGFWCCCLPQTYSTFCFSSFLLAGQKPFSRLSLAKPLKGRGQLKSVLPLSATLTPLVKLTHKVIQHLMRFMTKAPFSPQGDANVVLTLLPLPGRIQSFSSTISQLHPSLHCNGVILLLTHSRETAPLDDLVTILCSHAII